MYLVNANVWLWYLGVLSGPQEAEVKEFLAGVLPDQLLITEFSLYAVGINLLRWGMTDKLLDFVAVIQQLGVAVMRLGLDDFSHLIAVAKQFGLDFDDAYQVTVAEKVASEKGEVFIVSYDADFDRTPKGRLTPVQALGRERRR